MTDPLNNEMTKFNIPSFIRANSEFMIKHGRYVNPRFSVVEDMGLIRMLVTKVDEMGNVIDNPVLLPYALRFFGPSNVAVAKCKLAVVEMSFLSLQ